MRPPLRFACLPFLLSLALPFAAVAAAASDAYRWDSVAIGGGGFVSAIVPNATQQGLVYARTDVGGAYRWDGGSSSWTALNDDTSRADVGYLGVESLATDPTHPNRLYLLVGTSYFSNGRTAILRSDDYGSSFETIEVTDQFQAHGNGMGRQTGEKLQVDPLNPDILYCGTRSHGLFKSHDRGSTWTRLNGLAVTATDAGNGISFVILDPSSASSGTGGTEDIYVGVSRGSENLYRSTNGGATFAPVPGGPTALMPQRGALASDGTLYLTYANGAGPHGTEAFSFDAGGIWKLDTGTGDWTSITPESATIAPESYGAFGGISVDPRDPQRLIASTINTWMLQDGAYGDRFFLSTDGGASWIDLVARGFELDPNGITWIEGQSIHWAGSLEFDPFDSNVAWVTSGNGVYRCDDLSAPESVWKFAVHGLEETVPLDFVSIPDAPAVSVIGDYDGFLHTDPAEYAPVHRPGMGTTTGLAYAARQPRLLFRVGNALQRSEDGGESWSVVPGMKGERGSLALSADGTTLLHAPENASITYRSLDNGASWSPVTGLSVRNARPIADPVDENKFYVYADTRLHLSGDAGATFSPAGELPSGGMDRLATVPGKEGHLWFAHPSSGLYRSTDGGITFSLTSVVEQARAVGTGKAAVGSDYPTLFIWGTIGSVEGVFRSTDQGASWMRINDDAHQYGGPGNAHFIVGDQNVFGRVYLSTAGRGIAYGKPIGDSLTYAAWSENVFTAAKLANPTLSGEDVDPDRDGLDNLLEWILQTDPLAPTDLTAHTVAFSGQTPVLSVQQLAELTTASLCLEISTDLVNWSDIGTLFDESADGSANEITRSRIFLPASGEFPATLFLRARASR